MSKEQEAQEFIQMACDLARNGDLHGADFCRRKAEQRRAEDAKDKRARLAQGARR